MPEHVSRLALTEQPINWARAFIVGMWSSVTMMAFIDIYRLMGITQFTLETYLGSLVFGPNSMYAWTLGFFVSLVLGGIFGIFYAYCFEYVFYSATARLGIWVGIWHTIVAAVAFFPFFGMIHEFMNTGLFPSFGILGSALGPQTPILIAMAHLLFGLCMGTFYGPVRTDRVRARYFEPGVSGKSGEWDVITEEEDSIERLVV